ncbi:alpha/beta hydrolase [Engelhardtia mirabilis]|uniref:Alpha/beta hydrolase family protein n=1 Tax=Engelhardtia mirabilis TaxID=2528011 RepID=A0A518BSD3_9BACT|nr:Alpha/beta hydrolase family protein [Planctomycetes bacterium Pla133]QDV04204.1 Alpha/beta hydrolase family protein [Planctomycetes bacterium Pla86]
MQLTIPGPCGPLEAIYHEPRGGADAPRGVAVVCHPHPRPDLLDPNTTHQGGNMHSTVTFKIARALQNAGLACLRFNFRGVQGSAGEHDGKGAEEQDAAAALGWLSDKHSGVPRWAAGFSFGSRTVFGLARRDATIERLVLVGFPLVAYDLPGVDELSIPTLFVWGAGDEFGALQDLKAQYPHLPAQVEAEEIPGADHFFMRYTKELESCVHAWALRQLEGDDR